MITQTVTVNGRDAYRMGDRVHYPDANGPVYVCLIDGNVWSPADYPQGWEVESQCTTSKK